MAGLALALGPALRADVVLDWNAALLDAIRTDNSAPTLASRNLAILHTAIYDAVNSVVRTHQPYRFQLEAPPGTLPEAAAVGAAHAVFLGLYQPLQARAEALYGEFIRLAPSGPGLTNGLALGRELGRRVLDSRVADGANLDVPYIPSDAPGAWRRTPPFFRPPLTPQWRYVTPFALPALEPFLPPPPPPLHSPEYAASFNEVKAYGGKGSTNRTAYQTQTAVFWSDFSYTATPPGHWSEIAATIGRDRTNSLADNARMLALVNLAQADAGIVCWEAKYRHNLWRPVTAIQRADEDGNPDTVADPAWDHQLVSPPFPAYTSGHSSFSGATARVLARFYGTDAITFQATSDSLPGVFRTYHSLAECAEEVGRSRIYGGIHFSFDKTAGLAGGEAIGDYVSANFLLPLDALPLVRLEGFTDGRPVLRAHGHPGATCVLEASSDLAAWTPLLTNVVVTGGVVMTDPAPGGAARFYRLVER